MPGANERAGVKPEMAIFKSRGLKRGVEEADIKSFDGILADTEHYEDLLFFKNLVLYYSDRIKQTNLSEKKS